MRFIESLLGIAPDGGSGLLELSLMLLPLLAAGLVAFRRRVPKAK